MCDGERARARCLLCSLFRKHDRIAETNNGEGVVLRRYAPRPMRPTDANPFSLHRSLQFPRTETHSLPPPPQPIYVPANHLPTTRSKRRLFVRSAKAFAFVVATAADAAVELGTPSSRLDTRDPYRRRPLWPGHRTPAVKSSARHQIAPNVRDSPRAAVVRLRPSQIATKNSTDDR